MFACAISALKRNCNIRKDAADVDECAAVLPQMGAGDQRSVDHSPVVSVKQPPLVFERLVQHESIDGYARVVDPRVESAEATDGFISYLLHIVEIAHVANEVNCFAACCLNLVTHAPERRFVSGV